MASQFFGLYVAQSGLNAFQASINTTANNISNVETEGYSRQKVELKASSALRAFQKYGSVSTGVSAEQVIQLRDKYYDEKYWVNQSSYGYYDTKLYYQTQIEDYFTDSNATEGFTTIFNSIFNSLDSIKSSPSDNTVRAAFINEAEKLCRYFSSTSTQLTELQKGINDEIKAQVDDINSIASKIATLSKQINVLEVSGSNANELRDERAMLVDKLSEIVTVEVVEDDVIDPNYPDLDTGLTRFLVKLNGQSLVNTDEYNKLTVVARTEKDNLMDADGLYEVSWEKTGVGVSLYGYNQTGRLRSLFEMRDGNDNLNLKGTVTEVTTDTIKLENLNYTDLDKMNFPPRGDITIRGVDYNYNGFSVETELDDETGEQIIKSVTFNLTGGLTEETKAKIGGDRANIGKSVDIKGIPYYQNEMNTFLRSFAQAFNDIEHEAEDLYGNKGQSLFVATHPIDGDELKFEDETYLRNDDGTLKKDTFTNEEDTYYFLTASSIWVNSDIHDDLKLFASATYKPDDQGVDDSTIIDRLMRLQKKEVIYRNGGAATFLESIYSDVTVDTREATMFQEYYANIQASIDKQRKSISGVDEDEEAQNLVKFQNAYNLSSKVISVLQEMYNQLILNTF